MGFIKYIKDESLWYWHGSNLAVKILFGRLYVCRESKLYISVCIKNIEGCKKQTAIAAGMTLSELEFILKVLIITEG